MHRCRLPSSVRGTRAIARATVTVTDTVTRAVPRHVPVYVSPLGRRRGHSATVSATVCGPSLTVETVVVVVVGRGCGHGAWRYKSRERVGAGRDGAGPDGLRDRVVEGGRCRG